MLVYIADLLDCWLVSSVKSRSIKIIKGKKFDIDNKITKCKSNHKNKVLNFNNIV